MLKAVHAYTSDFYGKGLGIQAEVDFRSMDETALMCVGILLEEYMQNILGNTGDLVFVEAGEEKEGRGAVVAQDIDSLESDAHEHGRRVKETENIAENEDGGDEGSTSNTTETEDEHEALTSCESQNTENGFARKRARLASEDSDSSI